MLATRGRRAYLSSVASAKREMDQKRPASKTRVLRAAVVLLLVAALVVGNSVLASAISFVGGTMPCEMQMDTADNQLPPDGPAGMDRERMPQPCPMMMGGVCVMLVAVAPILASIPDPPHAAIRAIWLDETAAPHVVSPLRRPPRDL